jgi:hypothetical protein
MFESNPNEHPKEREPSGPSAKLGRTCLRLSEVMTSILDRFHIALPGEPESLDAPDDLAGLWIGGNHFRVDNHGIREAFSGPSVTRDIAVIERRIAACDLLLKDFREQRFKYYTKRREAVPVQPKRKLSTTVSDPDLKHITDAIDATLLERARLIELGDSLHWGRNPRWSLRAGTAG